MIIEVRRPTEAEIKTAAGWPIWTKEVSDFDWHYVESETCLIVAGRARVVDKSGESVEFSVGDWVVFPAGLHCRWQILEPIKKHYQFN